MLLNKRHQFVEQEFSVTIGATTAKFRNFGRRIFANASFSDVVNANDDHRLGAAAGDGRIRRVADVQSMPGT